MLEKSNAPFDTKNRGTSQVCSIQISFIHLVYSLDRYLALFGTGLEDAFCTLVFDTAETIQLTDPTDIKDVFMVGLLLCVEARHKC